MKYKINDFISAQKLVFEDLVIFHEQLVALNEKYRQDGYNVSIKWKHYPNEIDIRIA